MNWHNLTGTEIIVNKIKMNVYDVCKSCRKIWAKDEFSRYYIKVDKNENLKIVKSEKLL